MVKPESFLFELISKIRKLLTLSKNFTLFCFSENVLLSSDSNIDKIYQKHHDDDGFLYLNVATHKSLGGFN
jgi:hypothetical protein